MLLACFWLHFVVSACLASLLARSWLLANETSQIQASRAPGLDLCISNHISSLKRARSKPRALPCVSNHISLLKRAGSKPRELQVWICEFLITFHYGNEPNPSLESSRPGSVYFIIETRRIQASRVPGLDLCISNHISLLKRASSKPPGLQAWICVFLTTFDY